MWKICIPSGVCLREREREREGEREGERERETYNYCTLF